MRGIFPAKRKLVLRHSQPVDIIVPATKTQNVANVANHINSDPFSVPLTDDIYHRIVVAKVATRAPHVCTPVLVSSTGLGRNVG